MPENNRSWSRFILVGVVGSLLAFYCLIPIFARHREVEPVPRCLFNLRQIGLAMSQYTTDSGGYLPPVALGGSTYGWADEIFPYVKSEPIYQCPDETQAGQNNARLNGYVDYLFNARYAGAIPAKLNAPHKLILLVDGNDGMATTSARYSTSVIPPHWRTNADSPLYRHNGGANYLFVDGHVQWAKPSGKLRF